MPARRRNETCEKIPGFLGYRRSLFATAEEFLTVVVLSNDVPSYLFTLIVLSPSFLGFV
ncbi:MAG: hypothetical protein HY735_07375 [Verrucomicrobia bacterium]|nr:hypothetical protein [Verrucomicrobiota bacterium]